MRENLHPGPPAGISSVPLFHAAWLFGIGIASAQWVAPSASFALIALTLIAALSALAAFRAQRIAWLPLAALWILLGSWCAQMEPHPAPAPELAQLSDGLLRTVEGTVVDAGPMRDEHEENLDEPPSIAPSQRIDLRLSSIEIVTDDFDTQQSANGSARLTVRWPARSNISALQPFACGDRIRASARLLPPETYRDPGVWSRASYLLDQGVTSTASINIDRVDRMNRIEGADSTLRPSIACRLAAAQHLASDRLLALPARMRSFPAPLRLTRDDAILLAAIIAGDRTYLSHSLRVGFERTGSFHMLVVSGLHLGIVAGCIFWCARRIRLPRIAATLATIAGSCAYALFTGFAVPVQRSLWMVSLYLLGRLVYRQRSAMNTLGFAALCLLAASPRSLFDSSFQMTLLAIAAIAGVAAPLLERTIHPYLAAMRDLRNIALDPRLEPRVAQWRLLLRLIAESIEGPAELNESAPPSPIRTRIAWTIVPALIRFSLRVAELVVVSVIVELAMTLPMAIYFHRITVFALPVNLLTLPLLFLLVPLALMTLIATLIWPTAAIVPAAVTALPLHLSSFLVHLFGSLSLGDLRTPAPLLWESLVSIALLAAAIVLARAGRWQRRAAWVALFAAAFIAVAPRPIDHSRNALLIEAIDVGQGDSILVITPDGKTLLVDGGGFGGGPRQAPQEFDIGEEVVSPALWARGIRHLDVVALSHAHSDHMGGLPAVLRNFHPAELWIGNNPHFAAYDALLAEAVALHTGVRPLRAGDSLTLGAAQIAVLAPMRNYQPDPEPTNNDSLVMHVAYGGTSALLEGDAEAPVEQAMLAESGLQSTLLKVGHHGSTTSTRPEFLNRVAPQWAVISCGLHNRYGHPRPEVLEALEAAHIRTLSTDIGGASCFALDGHSITAIPMCAKIVP